MLTPTLLLKARIVANNFCRLPTYSPKIPHVDPQSCCSWPALLPISAVGCQPTAPRYLMLTPTLLFIAPIVAYKCCRLPTYSPKIPHVDPNPAVHSPNCCLPVVPARGGAEVALKIYIRPFSSIELACPVRQPSCVLLHMSHVKLHFALPTSHCSLHTPHFTLHTSHCTLKTPHFTLHTSHSTLHTSHYTLRTPNFTLHSPHFTLHSPHFTLLTPHCFLHTHNFTLHTSHCTLHAPHFTLHSSHSTLHLI